MNKMQIRILLTKFMHHESTAFYKMFEMIYQDNFLQRFKCEVQIWSV